MRKIAFVNQEFYHIYNRGVDKRAIFSDSYDLQRLYQSFQDFNSLEPIGSIYELSFSPPERHLEASLPSAKKLVRIICYALNPNHYHLLLQQETDKGIEKFMHRVGTGFTKYFNHRYKRTGALFQGVFKARHIQDNNDLLHLSAYINLNNKAHTLRAGNNNYQSALARTSWNEYERSATGICEKSIILEQFSGAEEYSRFCSEAFQLIAERKRSSPLDSFDLEAKLPSD
ncbi:MAG TPA: transposase [Candidatus Paceibacterota bacterium]